MTASLSSGQYELSKKLVVVRRDLSIVQLVLGVVKSKMMYRSIYGDFRSTVSTTWDTSRILESVNTTMTNTTMTDGSDFIIRESNV